MSYIQWSDQYSVKNQEIDEQHKKLFNIINQVHEAIEAGQGKAVIEKTIDGLLKYTMYHFSSEELYMNKFGYPEYATQVSQHLSLTQTTIDLFVKFQQDQGVTAEELLDFLKGWLINHILKSDMSYRDYLMSEGKIEQPILR